MRAASHPRRALADIAWLDWHGKRLDALLASAGLEIFGGTSFFWPPRTPGGCRAMITLGAPASSCGLPRKPELLRFGLPAKPTSRVAARSNRSCASPVSVGAAVQFRSAYIRRALGPPPFSSMNSAPASSKALRTADASLGIAVPLTVLGVSSSQKENGRAHYFAAALGRKFSDFGAARSSVGVLSVALYDYEIRSIFVDLSFRHYRI
jgi:hypothetical protein